MFYDFQSLAKHGVSPRGLPPEAPLFKLNSGEWQSLEEMIDGYETLTVSGRELLAPELTWANYAGADGGILTANQYEQRNIVIKYRLTANSDRAFRDKFTHLNTILSKRMLTFKFVDDPNFYWKGTLSAAETPEQGSNDITSTFTLTCPDPYKHAIEPHVFTGDSQVTIITESEIPTLPESVIYTPTQNTNNIVIMAHDKVDGYTKQIRLEGSFNAGESIKFIPLSVDNDNLYVYNIHSGENIADTMTFDSDIEDFTLRKDSVVTASPSGKLEISFREKAL